MHQALEAKMVGPAKTSFSIGTEFIDNRGAKRDRANIISTGFNLQKNDGMNMEHAYSDTNYAG